MDLDLFGTDGAPWQPQYWHAVDDRVRGGASQSYIDTLPSHPHRAHFHGTLDTTTLGGAGFASQVHTQPPSLPSAKYRGISLQVFPPKQKHLELGQPQEFVLTLKTQQPQRRPDGRLESRISFEYHFTPADTQSVCQPDGTYHYIIKWSDFVPTYRGRRCTGHLDPANLTEIGLMCRSNFGAQQGDFDLVVGVVVALKVNKSWLSPSGWWERLLGLIQWLRLRTTSGVQLH